MGILMNEIELSRKQALLALVEDTETWDKEKYTTNDYHLDSCLRIMFKYPKKSAGKPPYEWLDSKMNN